jgi:hypothetical protein
MSARVLPLLAEFGIWVAYCGASVDQDGGEYYVLMRAFASPAAREREEERFYASAQWRTGPRRQILDAIACYHTVLLPAADLRDGLRPAVT